MHNVLVAFLILISAGIMFLSILRTRKILVLLKDLHHVVYWKWLLVLMILFSWGYGAAIFLVLTTQTSWLFLLTGVVFFFGSLFVYLVVHLQLFTLQDVLDMLAERRKAEQAIREVNGELEQRVHELSTMNLIAQATAESHNLQHALDIAAHSITELFHSYSTSIALFENTSSALQVAASYPATEDEASVRTSLPLEHSLSLLQVAETREPLLVSKAELASLHTFLHPTLQAETIKKLLLVPLVSHHEFLGILFIDTDQQQRTFSPAEVNIAETTAQSIVRAILNAQLLQEEKRLRGFVEQKNQEFSHTLQKLEKTQRQLIQSEKMGVLGQLMAGIAHEIKAPLGAIRSAAGETAATLEQTLHELPAFFQTLPEQHHEAFFRLVQLANTRNTLISSREKRQRRKQLSESLEQHHLEHSRQIADRLVDMGIYENIHPFLALFQEADPLHILNIAYKISGLQESTQTITTAIDQASKIVMALKNYAHYDQSAEKVLTDITEGIETVLTLYHHQLKHGITVERHYESSEPIWCYADELAQVWTNLIHNAMYAMDGKGTLEVAVFIREEYCVAQFTDSGGGIPDEIRQRIFEPFFTTKPAGEGSGLGLDIVKKIIERHQGTIEVESQPGKTTFTICLPIAQEDLIDG